MFLVCSFGVVVDESLLCLQNQGNIYSRFLKKFEANSSEQIIIWISLQQAPVSNGFKYKNKNKFIFNHNKQ